MKSMKTMKKRGKAIQSMKNRGKVIESMKKMGKKVNLLPFLPDGIISQIIKGLDLKSIIKSKLVCKRWRNLISDLISNNLLARGDTLVYDPYLGRFGALDDETYQVAWISPPFNTPLACETGPWSVNGLVCFLSSFHLPDVYICNPFIGEYISFPKNHVTATMKQCSFGFCPGNNEYKLTMSRVHCLEIYTIGASPSGWRSIPFDFKQLRYNTRQGICVGGVLHWLLKTPSILTFDLAKEVFGSIPLPRLEDGKEVYRLECIDRCLVVTAGYNPPTGLEIWVRKEDKSSVWTKNWVIDADAVQSLDQIDCRRLRPRKFSMDGCIIFVAHVSTYMVPYIYDPRNKLVKPYHWDKRYRALRLAYNYSPTLVSPKKLVQKNGQEGSQSLPVITHQLLFLQRS